MFLNRKKSIILIALTTSKHILLYFGIKVIFFQGLNLLISV